MGSISQRPLQKLQLKLLRKHPLNARNKSNSAMASDRPLKRHLNSASDPCDLDFLTYRKDVHLRRFRAHLDALKAAHALSRAY
jgi:hypothetical protein